MSLFRRMYRGETNFDFVGNRRRWFALSGILLLISTLSLLTRGLDLGVDFVGGTVVEAPNQADASISAVRSALAGVGRANAKAQLVAGGEGIRVQLEELTEAQLAELVAVVAEVAGVDEAEVSSQEVGPTFGEQVTDRAVRALIIFLIVVAIFISIRFEWKMALAGLVALGHDLVLTAGVYSVTGFEVTPATVIAILTILGYSLYDTVVVFDKVEEQIEEQSGKRTITTIVNDSMNQVLMRSINTSLTSLLPVGSLLFVGSYLLGAATLREFALALFVGIGAGTYSSIAVASPLLAVWKERETEWAAARRRVARRARVSTDEVDEVVATATAARPSAERQPTGAPPGAPTGARARPPRKRRKRRR